MATMKENLGALLKNGILPLTPAVLGMWLLQIDSSLAAFITKMTGWVAPWYVGAGLIGVSVLPIIYMAVSGIWKGRKARAERKLNERMGK